MSISLFPGAVDADLKGHAGSFFQRCQKIVGACICFLISGGDLEALTEDILDREEKVEQTVGRGVHEAGRRAGAAARSHLDPLGLTGETVEDQDPAKPTKVIHRAITPLYAGTAPEAGRLNGRVGVSGLPTLTYQLIGRKKKLFSVSHRLGTHHTSK